MSHEEQRQFVWTTAWAACVKYDMGSWADRQLKGETIDPANATRCADLALADFDKRWPKPKATTL
jgi:hypothetical protein